MMLHCQIFRISRPYRDAQDSCSGRQDLSCMYLSHHEPEGVKLLSVLLLLGVFLVDITTVAQGKDGRPMQDARLDASRLC